MEEDLAKSVVTLDGNEKKMDFFENKSRRNNIIIVCVPREKVKTEKCLKWKYKKY